MSASRCWILGLSSTTRSFNWPGRETEFGKRCVAILRGRGQRQGEVERCALAVFAFEPESRPSISSTSRRLMESPSPEPPEPTGSRGVRLAEGIKQFGLLFLGDADARVRDVQLELGPSDSASDFQRHLAFAG